MFGESFDQDLLGVGLQRLKIPCSPKQFLQLSRFLQELGKWNRAYGFVKADPREIVIRHVLDSLGPLELLRTLPRDTVVDVGSGAGFPGIPLAVFMTESEFTLLERSAKRAAFLRTVGIVADISFRVLEEEVQRTAECFDLAVFRALSPLGKELPRLKELLNPGGTLAAYKGRRSRIDEELTQLPQTAVVHPVMIPFLEEQRHLVLIKNEGEPRPIS